MTEIQTTGSGGALALRADQSEWTPTQQAALVQLGVGEAPQGDQLVFLHVAQRMQLDPFNKEIYMIGRWDSTLQRKKWTIQVGIDGFRSKSEEHPEYAGIDGPHWCGPDGAWHDVWVKDEPPVAARFTVFRKDWPQPIHAVAHYREYVQKKSDGKPNSMWQNAPANQIGKCAEAAARRKAFPRKLTGVYAPEELEHLNNPEPAPVIAVAQRTDTTASEPDWDTLISAAENTGDSAELRKVWDLARGMRAHDGALLERIAAAGERVNAKAAKQASENTTDRSPQQPASTGPVDGPPVDNGDNKDNKPRSRLYALLRDGGVNGTDRPQRLRIVNRILTIENRAPSQPVTSFDHLGAEDFQAINGYLQRHKDEGDLTHTLADLGKE